MEKNTVENQLCKDVSVPFDRKADSDMHSSSVHKIVIQPNDCKMFTEIQKEPLDIRTNYAKSNEILVITRSFSPMKQVDKTLYSKFEALPTEVILHVFSYLKIVDLVKCGQVSKRFSVVSNDEQYLWPKKLNLCYKKVPVGFLQKLLESGCEYLSLSEAILKGTLNLQKTSRLKYLSLSGCVFEWNKENPEKMLESNCSLEKLSLSKFHLSSNLINIISLQNGKTLRVLDLSKCTFCTNEKNCTHFCLGHSGQWTSITRQSFKHILENCTELKELSLNSTKLCEASVDILVSNLTSKIEKLGLFDIPCVGDKHVKTLVTRCKKLTELDLGGETSITRQSLKYVIANLKSTLIRLNLQFTNVKFDLSDFYQMTNMEKLRFFCYDNDGSGKIRRLKKMLFNIQIDDHSGNIRIASPYGMTGDRYGFWEIKAKQEELFKVRKQDQPIFICRLK